MTTSTNPTDQGVGVLVIVAARNEADRIAATLAALAEAFPGAPVWVADDGSTDETAAIAAAAGATVVGATVAGATVAGGERTGPRRSGGVGKGAAVTRAAGVALADLAERAEALEASAGVDARSGLAHDGGDTTVAVLCDGDLDRSAALLGPLVDRVRGGEADLAVAVFARRVGGGVGVAVGFARWAIRRRCGLTLRAPISGQRALSVDLLERVAPFADGFGMEIGMTIDAARAGARVREVDLDLSHRATGRTLGGFVHRGRQLVDFVRVYLARR